MYARDCINILPLFQLFQQEVASRRSMVMTMVSTPGMEPELQNQLQELANAWERVQDLTDHRETKLQESLRLVRDYTPDDVYQTFRIFDSHLILSNFNNNLMTFQCQLQ